MSSVQAQASMPAQNPTDAGLLYNRRRLRNSRTAMLPDTDDSEVFFRELHENFTDLDGSSSESCVTACVISAQSSYLSGSSQPPRVRSRSAMLDLTTATSNSRDAVLLQSVSDCCMHVGSEAITEGLSSARIRSRTAMLEDSDDSDDGPHHAFTLVKTRSAI